MTVSPKGFMRLCSELDLVWDPFDTATKFEVVLWKLPERCPDPIELGGGLRLLLRRRSESVGVVEIAWSLLCRRPLPTNSWEILLLPLF